MKLKLTRNSLLLVALLLALTRTSPASTTWYVDGVHGNNGNNCKAPASACKTIGHAISLASSGDTIRVAAAVYTENLTIGISLSVLGSGANTTIVDGGGAGTVVTIPKTGASVFLSRMTITHGRAQYGAGVSNSGALMITNTTISGNQASCAMFSFHSADGGGISNVGMLTIYNSTISGNGAFCRSVEGGAGAYGGGISNGGTLTIKSSTVSGNSTYASALANNCYRFICHAVSEGGGVYNGGTLTITNSTLSGNSARAFAVPPGIHVFGGGIYNGSYENAALSSDTLGSNSADSNLGFHGGGGIFNSYGSIVVRNTIVANNSGGNCDGTMVSNGYNLSDDTTCKFSNSGDRNNTDPKLGTLGYYGGSTQTIPLLSGSPAIDAGNPSGCTDSQGNLLKTDQRGQPRPDKEDTGRCDMGAYERQSD